jgi:hypothetical protein
MSLKSTGTLPQNSRSIDICFCRYYAVKLANWLPKVVGGTGYEDEKLPNELLLGILLM